MPDRSTPPTPTQPRVIRVFVSSTFRDMHAEREELVKRIFPQLRKLCEQRGVTWGEVDLRWGIPDEQKAEGKVLPICLAEIQRCRPYFIGLLGERYGWVPDEITKELIEQQPWLAEHLEHSVTELEILHGVLRNPAMADHAFFYFRNPAYIDSLPPEQQGEFREQPTPEEVSRFGWADAQHRAEDRRRKLAALKSRIRASGLPVRENYPDPQALGQLVAEDFTALINRLYPEEEKPDPLDREAAEHEAFAESRARVYIGRQEYFDRLDAHAQGGGPPLVILGESGVGKSALLANWALRYRDEHPEDLVIAHFIGATPYSADWAAMLLRILGELKRHFEIQQEIPDKPDDLRAAFANWLHIVAAACLPSSSPSKIILVLDALNQLEDRDGAPGLVWLPPVIPANIRLILSTLPGRSLDDLQKRSWPTMQVRPLELAERQQFITEYLAQYTKALSPARGEQVAEAQQSANPLYLRALLEELRVFGEHNRLDERIASYLEAQRIPHLYEKILARYEEDYERDQPGLVREVMSLLWAARRGLSETELLELLGASGQPLPRAIWSPLYLAAEPSLVSRSGLIGFVHDYLCQAVQDRYLSAEIEQQAAHRRLADYFDCRDMDGRKVEELPWQLAQAKSWQRLYDRLTDLTFLDATYGANRFDVIAYWVQIERNSPFRIVDAYPTVPDPYIGHPTGYAFTVACLLSDTGHKKEALGLYGGLFYWYCESGNREMASVIQINQAGILLDLDHQDVATLDLDHQDIAMSMFKNHEQISRELGNRDILQSCLGNQAVVFMRRGELDVAMGLLEECEQICRELGNRDGLQLTFGNQATILRQRGDLDGALTLYKEAERLCRELGDKAHLATYLDNQADILHARGDLDGATAFFQEAEQICRELGNRDRLQLTFGKRASVLRERGDLDGAMTLLKEKERICTEIGNEVGLQDCLSEQARILYVKGDLDGAMVLLKDVERLIRSLRDNVALRECLGKQANILADRGELAEAVALYKDEEEICRELGEKVELLICLDNQARILKTKGDLDGALALCREEEQLCRELGNKDVLANILGNHAGILYARGDLDGALALCKEQERLCRELSDMTGVHASLVGQTIVLNARNDLDGAMELYRQRERLCREMGQKRDLAVALENQAVILELRDDLEGAMVLHRESESIHWTLGNGKDLANSLIAQARILHLSGRDTHIAKDKCKEALDILESLALHDEAARARILLIQIGLGGTPRLQRHLSVTLLVVFTAFGVGLGLWKPWLWLIGGPIALLAGTVLLSGLLPSIFMRFRLAYEVFVLKLVSETKTSELNAKKGKGE